jgi:FMN reductase
MSHIVTIAGSPAQNAKSSAILDYIGRLLRRSGVHTNPIIVRDLPPTDLIHARLDSEAVAAANLLLDQAEGVIIATPVYKAAYSGVLKTFLDLLPQDALQGKTILPIATGGSSAHLLALDYALKPVLCALGATHILRGVYVTDSQIQIEHGGLIRLDDAVELRLQASLNELIGGQTYSRSKRSAVAATPVTI